MNSIFIVLSCLLAYTITSIQSEGWRGIVPLHSTRADVERLIGRPNLKSGLYNFEYELVEIGFSGGSCREGDPGGWNVPPDTVTSIRVAPKARLRLTDMSIDESKYEKTDGGHLTYVFYYTNKEEGIQLEVIKDAVVNITYFPNVKDTHLRCPDNRPKPPQLIVSGELSLVARQLLDGFMLRLKQEPNVSGRIRIDIEGKRLDETALAELVTEYIKSKYPVEFGRVTVIEEYRLSQEMELFLVPRGGDPIPFSGNTSKPE